MRHARSTLPQRQEPPESYPAPLGHPHDPATPAASSQRSTGRRVYGAHPGGSSDPFDDNEPLLPPPHDSAPWDLHKQRPPGHQDQHALRDQRRRDSTATRDAHTRSDTEQALEVGPRSHFDGASTQQLSAEEGGQGRELPPAPPLGRVGRYVLTLRMGAGGIGTVWAAHDPMLSRVVAIKTLPHRPSSDARARPAQDFLDEARAAARLSHPHIVTVFDAGVSADGSYIVMELLRGKDLSQLIKANWRPSPQSAASIIQRVAEAIDYAHGQGVIHRDIKPANIFMVDRVRPMVLDFGIAHSGMHIGQSVNVQCSPYYAAPEQLAGDNGDRRTDVYALGVVLYELLTGERPYSGETLDEVTTAVNTARPPPIQRLRSGVSTSLIGITMRAMARDPEQRYRSAGALARALESWLQERGVSVANPYAIQHQANMPIEHRMPAWARQRQRRLFALAAVLGAAGLVVALFAQPAHERPISGNTVGSNATALTAAAEGASR
jgi:serine/threonine-protein kinase